MLKIENSCLVVVDIQGRLAQLMHDKETLFKNAQILVQAAKILDIPILWCQQVPEALGPTIPEIAELLNGDEPINKAFFSCAGEAKFKEQLKTIGRSQVILCGIETHVCVWQTASDLLTEGLTVDVITDAVSSRTLENKNIGLNRMQAAGANLSSTEMALFELLQTAKHPEFKKIAKLIK
jgi:nicotinamidase-related amidase